MKRAILIGLLGTGCFSLACQNTAKAEVTPNKDSAAYYYTMGKQEYNARKYSNAWRYFEKASNFDPTSVDMQRSIADVCLIMNKMAPAIKALENANRLKPDDKEVLWKLTQLYFTYSNWDKTIEFCQKVRQQIPNQKGVFFMTGKAYYSQQNYGKGIEHLRQAIKEEPNNAEANYLIGRMLVLMSNYKNAVPYYERSLQLDSTTQPNRYYEFAQVLATAEDFDKAIVWFQKALDKGYKARDDFYMNMAYTFADAKKADQAIKMLKDILDRRPQDLSLLSGIADVCYHAGRYKEAINYWDKILAYDDKNARSLYMIGLSYIKMGNDKDGMQLCDRAIAMDPSLAVLKHQKTMP